MFISRLGVSARDFIPAPGRRGDRVAEGRRGYRLPQAPGGASLLDHRGIPIELAKAIVSREAWCALVEEAFQSAVSIAGRLELPIT